MVKTKLTESQTGLDFDAVHEETLKVLETFEDILTNFRYEGKVSLGRNVRRANAVLDFFSKHLLLHFDTEERALFPFVAKHIPKLDPVVALFRSEHRDFKTGMQNFERSLHEMILEKTGTGRAPLIDKIYEQGTYLIYLLRNHIRAEAESIYKEAQRGLKSSEKIELMKQIRG